MKRLLLHVCCAPDGTVPWKELVSEGYNVSAFFYGNNIHPYREFLKRKEAVTLLAEHMHGNAIINEYDPKIWVNSTIEHVSEPEGGNRCSLCFQIQIEASASAALKHHCQYLCTTLTISPHKDPALINRIGYEVANRYGLIWIERIWRKNSGFKRSVELSREIGLYRQSYCGCIYSFRGDELSDE